ncbi:hypothetical protein VNO77_23258 [Canavalia gladiata]|uniref:Uncharacterized protein n=1 Tax=Canavalia gladiata TaxID=3824 RepID=A0AAN9L480_CANGL
MPHAIKTHGDGYMVGRLVVLAYDFSLSCLLSVKPLMLTHGLEYGISYGIFVHGEMMREWHTITSWTHRARSALLHAGRKRDGINVQTWLCVAQFKSLETQYQARPVQVLDS